jgi:hypothetical protein
MRHVRKLSEVKVPVPDKAMDPAGAIFLQIWAAVMGAILFGAFGGKG